VSQISESELSVLAKGGVSSAAYNNVMSSDFAEVPKFMHGN